jgi:hypothetical protein
LSCLAFIINSFDGGKERKRKLRFKPKPRKDKSIKNGYLIGTYGALPVLGDMLSE